MVPGTSRVISLQGNKVHQIKSYDEGVGSEGGWWSKMIEGATGKELNKILRI